MRIMWLLSWYLQDNVKWPRVFHFTHITTMSSVGSKITRTSKTMFILFDIKHSYLTITKELLSKHLYFAPTKLQISKDDKKIIYHYRKLLLLEKENMWMEKGRDVFNVIMETYDGMEVCKLVGTFSFEKISEICN